jgi:copper chaperone CopZ
VRVALKNVSGVDSVEVSLNKGLADVTLKPGNTVTMQQLQRAITKNGFTTKQSIVTVSGTVLLEQDKLKLRVSGTSEIYELLPAKAQTQNPDARQMNGKTVTVEGVIPETSKGETPDKIQFNGIHE